MQSDRQHLAKGGRRRLRKLKMKVAGAKPFTRTRRQAKHAEVPDATQAKSQSTQRFLRFMATSLICTALDQLLAALLFWWLKDRMPGAGFTRILIGTLLARCASISLNFFLNHKLVFSLDELEDDMRRPSKRESLPRFAVLAAGVLLLSTIGVYVLHTFFGVVEWQAKVFVDIMLFFVNYTVQRKWVFRTEVSVAPSKIKPRK